MKLEEISYIHDMCSSYAIPTEGQLRYKKAETDNNVYKFLLTIIDTNGTK